MLAGQLGDAVRVGRVRLVGRLVGASVCPESVEDFVRRHHDERRSSFDASGGHLAYRRAVATQSHGRLPGTAVDVGPGGGVDDCIRPMQRHQSFGRARVVQVVLGQVPGEDLLNEGRRAERLDQSSAEAPSRSRDGHAHQAIDLVTGLRLSRPGVPRTGDDSRRPTRRT